MLHKKSEDSPLLMLMRERGFTQSSLARACGVSQSTLSRILSDHAQTSAGTLVKLATVLSVDIGTLCAPLVDPDSVILRGSLRPDIL